MCEPGLVLPSALLHRTRSKRSNDDIYQLSILTFLGSLINIHTLSMFLEICHARILLYSFFFLDDNNPYISRIFDQHPGTCCRRQRRCAIITNPNFLIPKPPCNLIS